MNGKLYLGMPKLLFSQATICIGIAKLHLVIVASNYGDIVRIPDHTHVLGWGKKGIPDMLHEPR